MKPILKIMLLNLLGVYVYPMLFWASTEVFIKKLRWQGYFIKQKLWMEILFMLAGFLCIPFIPWGIVSAPFAVPNMRKVKEQMDFLDIDKENFYYSTVSWVLEV